MSHFEIESLSYRRESFLLELSLDLEKGSTGVILGPSGCGKTSLLRCVAGLERPDRGIIRLGGKEIGSLEPGKRNLGFIFQDLALFDHLSGRGNLEFGLKRRGVGAAERNRIVGELSALLHIGDLLERKPSGLSGGERQRLAVARSLAYSPELLLLDEPLSSLDAPLRRELRAFLSTALKDSGATSLHVTHDMDEALELADILFIMRSGRIVARGSPEDIYARPPNDFTASFLGLGSLLDIDGIEFSDSLCRVGTALGILDFDARRIDPAAAASPKSYRVFLPKKAVGLARPGSSAFRIPARVERLVFAGDGFLVQAAAEAGQDEGRKSIPLSFEADPGLGLRLGEKLDLALNLEDCSILPRV